MQTEFAAIAAPVYQSRRLCSFVDVVLKTVEVFAPFTGCGMELSSSRGHAKLAAIQLFTKLLRPSCAARLSQFTGCGERLLGNESGLLTNCQQARDTVRISPQPHRCPKWWTAKEKSFWPW